MGLQRLVHQVRVRIMGMETEKKRNLIIFTHKSIALDIAQRNTVNPLLSPPLKQAPSL